MSGVMGDGGEIIILSDDEDVSCTELSVFIVEKEELKKNDEVLPKTPLEEDLVVTFSRRPEVLPHARYDCSTYPFTATDCEAGNPVANNQLICDQCFCYVCDKLASACLVWTHSGLCHCNSHNRSDFWKNQRSSSLLRGLKTFDLTLSEIDGHLRHAEMMLQNFKQELSVVYSTFLQGKTIQEYGVTWPNSQFLISDYTTVYEFVSSFLNKADEQEDRAAAIMRLGAAEEFLKHFQTQGFVVLQPSSMANAMVAKAALLQRVVASLQRQMVTANFTPEFSQKLQDFYKRLYLPAKLKSFKNSLCVRPWCDILLMSVLKGQNVSGVRKCRGKKDVLIEQIPVVRLRTELLQRQNRYRELCRYLCVVQSDIPILLQPLQDLVPFFTCTNGDWKLACHSLFPSVNAPASRFTPALFQLYLRVFESATAPALVVTEPAQLCCSEAKWEPVKGAVPLKRAELVRFALRVHACCPVIFNDSPCWTRLLTIVNSPRGSSSSTALPPPSQQFLLEAKDVASSILLTQHGTNIQIPRFFLEVHPDQALLLLVTRALALRILHAPLTPALPVLATFKENAWALWWLWDSLSTNRERLNAFLEEVTKEISNTSSGGISLGFLDALVPSLSPSAEHRDHTYCNPATVNFYAQEINARSHCQLSS